jgi:hypothetical protein
MSKNGSTFAPTRQTDPPPLCEDGTRIIQSTTPVSIIRKEEESILATDVKYLHSTSCL